MENIKTFEFMKNNKKLEMEVYWGHGYELFINYIKVNDKKFDLKINKCELMKNDKYGDILRINTNIKNKEVQNLVKELTGKELKNTSALLIITKDLRYDLDQYIHECYLLKNTDSNSINDVLEQEREIFKQAKETGKKQLLYSWIEPCNNPSEECNLDKVYIYAMPNGTKKTERYHSF